MLACRWARVPWFIIFVYLDITKVLIRFCYSTFERAIKMVASSFGTVATEERKNESR
jgi:hypothetical protein